MKRHLVTLPLVFIFALPLFLSLVFVLPDFIDLQALINLLQHPQFWGALKLTLLTGLTSTALSLLLAILITANTTSLSPRDAGAMLAVPHLALAVGLALLIMPTGVLARLLAIPFSWSAPPQWVTTQDPYGLALAVALVLKETPFLVWAFVSLLHRDDLRRSFDGQTKVAKSLGHGNFNTWVKVLLPQLVPRMVWPLVAVFAYGMTVVDMALVIGPSQPPTLASLIWTDLNDGEVVNNQRGAAGVLVLSFVILMLSLVVGVSVRRGWSSIHVYPARTTPRGKLRNAFLGQIWGLWGLFYLAVTILLLIQSFATLWTFPDLVPQLLSAKAWASLMQNPKPFLTSVWLALATSGVATLAAIAWLESQPPRHDKILLALCGVALCLPALMIALGQYRLFLKLGLTGTALGLFLAHALPVSAYVIVMLHGPYRGFDQRWQAVSSGLMVPRRRFLTQVKWPLLKGPIWAAWAVGFAVSVAQFVPAQLAAAGRFSTLPMEAVTLSSGGNRALVASSALLLAALPLMAFLIAARFGKARWS